MASLTYSADYWKRATKLVDANPHACEYCRRNHCEKRGEDYCFVRVIDIGAKPGDPKNLVLACRRCRPNPRGPKLSKKQILDKIAELPFTDRQMEAAGYGG